MHNPMDIVHEITVDVIRGRIDEATAIEKLNDVCAFMETQRLSIPDGMDALRHLKKLLSALNDPCWHDHHGNCQAHFCENPCCVAEAREYVAKVEGTNHG